MSYDDWFGWWAPSSDGGQGNPYATWQGVLCADSLWSDPICQGHGYGYGYYKVKTPYLTDEENNEVDNLFKERKKYQPNALAPPSQHDHPVVKQIDARLDHLNALSAARNLKAVKDTTGSYPTPAKIPSVLKPYHKHTMPDKIPEIIEKAHAGQPLSPKEDIQLHAIHARGVVQGCGSGCNCVDGHCEGNCPAHGFECSGSRDIRPAPSQHPERSPIDNIVKGIGDWWAGVTHPHPKIIGAVGGPLPIPIEQAPVIPVIGFGYAAARKSKAKAPRAGSKPDTCLVDARTGKIAYCPKKLTAGEKMRLHL